MATFGLCSWWLSTSPCVGMPCRFGDWKQLDPSPSTIQYQASEGAAGSSNGDDHNPFKSPAHQQQHGSNPFRSPSSPQGDDNPFRSQLEPAGEAPEAASDARAAGAEHEQGEPADAWAADVRAVFGQQDRSRPPPLKSQVPCLPDPHAPGHFLTPGYAIPARLARRDGSSSHCSSSSVEADSTETNASSSAPGSLGSGAAHPSQSGRSQAGAHQQQQQQQQHLGTHPSGRLVEPVLEQLQGLQDGTINCQLPVSFAAAAAEEDEDDSNPFKASTLR